MPEKPNYTEDTVAIFIEHYFVLLTWPFQHFSLELFSKKKERILGSDARLFLSSIKTFKPLYIQFKRPVGYSAWDKNGRPNNRSKIIQERRTLNLTIDPVVLAFNLRNKRPQHRDFQHNVLFRLLQLLRQYKTGDAAYVCPLFLDRTAYVQAIHWAGIEAWFSNRMGEGFWLDTHPLERLGRGAYKIHSLRSQIESFPIIKEHVVIRPHLSVKNAKHWYSFTDRGDEICFHSPEHISENELRLSFWLEELSKGLSEPTREHGFLDLTEANRVLPEFVSAIDPNFKIKNEGWAAWMEWGNFLEKNYQIMQYAILIKE